MGNTSDGQPAGHHRVDALLDSGSSLSFVHPEAIENLPGVVYTQGPKFRLRLGDGAEKLIDGRLAHLVVRVRACDGPLPCVPHTFRVWDRLPYGCILGYDFLRLHGVCCEPTPSGLHLEYKGLDTREAAKAALDALSDGFDSPPVGGGTTIPEGPLLTPATLAALLEIEADQATEATGGPEGLDEPAASVACDLSPESQYLGMLTTPDEDHETSPTTNEEGGHLAPAFPTLEELLDTEEQRALDAASRPHVETILREFKDTAFAPPTFGDRGPQLDRHGKPMEFDIRLVPGAKAPAPRPQRLGREQARLLAAELRKFLDTGVAERGDVQWVSPVFLVAKKDGEGRRTGWRPVLDLRQLNAQCETEYAPLPDLRTLIESFVDVKFATVLDIAQAFHAATVAPESRKLLGLSCPGVGTIRLRQMPMGHKNSPSVLAAITTEKLGDLIEPPDGSTPQVLVFVDDIAVLSHDGDVSTHFRLVREVIRRLADAHFHLKASKVKFAQKYVRYLGVIAGGGRILADAHKVQPILHARRPRSLTTLRQFLGMIQYFRSFIPNLSARAEPLTTLTSPKAWGGSVTMPWRPEHTRAFEDLKQALSQAPSLALPRGGPGTVYRLSVDASEWAVGSALEEQDPEGTFRLLGFASTKLLSYQRGYSSVRKEMIAIITSLRHWSHLLRHGEGVTVQTDCSALKYMLERSGAQMSDPELRLTEELSAYAADIQWVPGKANGVADWLSRCPGTERRVITVVDLCSGSGSSLAAFARMARDGEIDSRRSIRFYSVEKDPLARRATRALYDRICRDPSTQGLFVSPTEGHNLTALGHDVRALETHPSIRDGTLQVDILLGGLPCQPFSQASGNRAAGLKDPRELFGAVHSLLRQLRAYNPDIAWVLETVHFARHLQPDFEDIVQRYQEFPGMRVIRGNTAAFHPQWRRRVFLTNLAVQHPPNRDHTYEQFLAARGLGRPCGPHPRGDGLAHTVLASSSARVYREGLLHYEGPDGRPTEPTIDILEGLQGLDPGVTDVDGATPEARRRLAGNAWCPDCIRLFLASALQDMQLYIGLDARQPEGGHALHPTLEAEDPGHPTAPGPVDPETRKAHTAALHMLSIITDRDFEQALIDAAAADPDYQTHRARVEGHPAGEIGTLVSSGQLILDPKNRLLVPAGVKGREVRARLVQYVHDFGHAGVEGTFGELSRMVSWPRMREDVTTYVRGCIVCQTRKNTTTPRRGRAHPLPVAPGPGHEWSLDFLSLPEGKMWGPEGEQGVDAVMVITDRFSHFMGAYPYRKRGFLSSDLCQLVLTQAVPLFDLPDVIVSDRDRLYAGRAWADLHNHLLGTNLQKTTSHRPQGDGAAERSHRTLLESLRCALVSGPLAEETRDHDADPSQWPQVLPHVLMVLNSTPRRNLNTSPFHLHFGRQPRTPLARLVQTPERVTRSYSEHVAHIGSQYRRACQIAAQLLEAQRESMIQRQPTTPDARTFTAGDLVLVAAPSGGVAHKLDRRYQGPYEVLRRRGDSDVYELRRGGLAREQCMWNADKLRRLHEVDPADWPGDRLQPVSPPEHWTNGPAVVEAIDWQTTAESGAPPRWIVKWTPLGEQRIIEQDELVGGYTSGPDCPQAIVLYLRQYCARHGSSSIRELNVPSHDSAAFDVYNRIRHLLWDTCATPIGPEFEASPSTAAAPGQPRLTPRAVARATQLMAASPTVPSVRVPHRRSAQSTPPQAAPATHPVESDEWKAVMARRKQAAAQGQLLRKQVGLPTETPALPDAATPTEASPPAAALTEPVTPSAPAVTPSTSEPGTPSTSEPGTAPETGTPPVTPPEEREVSPAVPAVTRSQGGPLLPGLPMRKSVRFTQPDV